MWVYEKRLQYPVNIKNPDPQMAQVIITQMGGPDGELAASMRYISQRYAMPNCEVAGLLTDIGVSVTVLRIFRKFTNMIHCQRWLFFRKYHSLQKMLSSKSVFEHTDRNRGDTDGKSVIFFREKKLSIVPHKFSTYTSMVVSGIL